MHVTSLPPQGRIPSPGEPMCPIISVILGPQKMLRGSRTQVGLDIPDHHFQAL